MVPMLTVDEAARKLGLGKAAVYQLAASGMLPCHRLGPNRGRIRFTEEDLASYVESTRSVPRRKKAAPPASPLCPQVPAPQAGGLPVIRRPPFDGR